MGASAKCARRGSAAGGDFRRKRQGDIDWTYYERPLLDDLLALKEILMRKYQRRRASNEDVASVEKLIANQMEAGR
jgi:hypothetical protein